MSHSGSHVLWPRLTAGCQVCGAPAYALTLSPKTPTTCPSYGPQVAAGAGVPVLRYALTLSPKTPATCPSYGPQVAAGAGVPVLRYALTLSPKTSTTCPSYGP